MPTALPAPRSAVEWAAAQQGRRRGALELFAARLDRRRGRAVPPAGGRRHAAWSGPVAGVSHAPDAVPGRGSEGRHRQRPEDSGLGGGCHGHRAAAEVRGLDPAAGHAAGPTACYAAPPGSRRAVGTDGAGTRGLAPGATGWPGAVAARTAGCTTHASTGTCELTCPGSRIRTATRSGRAIRPRQ